MWGSSNVGHEPTTITQTNHLIAHIMRKHIRTKRKKYIQKKGWIDKTQTCPLIICENYTNGCSQKIK